MTDVQNNDVEIPMDVFDSQDELVLVMPLWGVDKESLNISLEKTTIVIEAERKSPVLKETLMPVQENCYWWMFSKRLELPQNVYFDKIHTKLTSDNILIVIVPKVIIPERVQLQVEYN